MTAKAVSALAAGWALLLLSSKPLGEFPLNDDWVYAAPVRSLLEEGRLVASPYVEATHVAQVAWGTLFCLPGGWSYSALRLSTAVLGLVALLALLGLLREAGASPWAAWLGAACLAVNPFFFNLSLTFMTDVPFTAWSVAALYFFARALRRPSGPDLAAGIFFSTASVLTRQAGIIVPVAFLLVGVSAAEGRRGRRALLGALPLAVSAAAFLAWHVWARSVGIDWLANDRVKELAGSLSRGPEDAARQLGGRAVIALSYVGLSLLPLTLLASLRSRDEERQRGRKGAAAVAALLFTAAPLAVAGRSMPLTDNVLYDLGLGPPTLWDVYMLHLPNLPTAPRGFWLGVTGLGLLGAALLAVALTRVSWSPARPALSLVAAAAFLYTALLVTAGFFDRYLIVLCALAVMPAGVAASRPRHSGRLRLVATGLSGGLLLAYGAFAAAGTHDYFAWNRARWRAIDDAVRSRGIPVTGFDGGYEWNGPNRYTPTTPWWWADREPWVLTFGPVAGYEEVARYAFRRWLPPGEGAVLLLRRADP